MRGCSASTAGRTAIDHCRRAGSLPCRRDVDADTSKKRIIDKREMKAVLGRSPDYFDPLMMRMYYEIVPQPKGMRARVGAAFVKSCFRAVSAGKI